MTPQQFSRWYRFALRMAHRGWQGLPRKSRKQVASYVKDFFRRLENFDDPKHPLLPRLRSWDHTDECGECVANRPEAERTRNWYKLNTCHCQPLICDIVDEMVDDWNPFYFNDNARSDRGGYQYNRWDETWGIRIRCCIRAGMDLASEGAGVLGFEVCDLRRMYRGNIPAWINNGEWQPAIDLNQGECAVGIWL